MPQRKLNDRYEKFCCIYCGKFTVRKKVRTDWKKGEKLTKGFFDKSQAYYVCEFCGKTMLELL